MNEMLDCNDVPINIGDKVKRVIDGKEGKVVNIIKRETHEGKKRSVYAPIFFGDLIVRTSPNSSIVSNQYKNWQVIH